MGPGTTVRDFLLTCLSCLLDVESVGNVEDVWVDKADRIRDVLLELGAWVEHEFDPALGSLVSNVVLQWSSDLALAGKDTIHEPVKDRRFNSRHYSSSIFITNTSLTLAILDT